MLRKGINKLCYGVLLVCSTIFLSLSNLCLTDVNALSYPVNTLPISPDYWRFRKIKTIEGNERYVAFPSNLNFSITEADGHSFPSGFDFPHMWRFTGNYDQTSGNCVLPSPVQGNGNYYTDGVYSVTGNYRQASYSVKSVPSSTSILFRQSELFGDDSPFDTTVSLWNQMGSDSFFDRDTVVCSILGYRYTNYLADNVPAIERGFPKWDFGSLINIPLVNNRLNYENSKPYTYSYDVLYLNGIGKDSNGVSYRKDGVKMSEIFHTSIPTFSRLWFPLDEFNESQNWLSPDDSDDESTEEVYNFSVNGSIVFDEDFSLSSDAKSFLTVYNYYDPNISSSTFSDFSSTSINGHTVYEYDHHVYSDVPCSLIEHHIDDGDDENRLDFSCYYDPVVENAFSEKVNFRYLNLNLVFHGSWERYTPFFSTTGDYTFKDFSIVTNNNDTPSGWSGSSTGTGGDLSLAPGTISAQGGVSDVGGEPDFLLSLKELFTFDFINPFAGIFNLFSDQSSCASIPTLAGMLHSEEDTVCPWFDSNVRGVVTPVFGLSSVMLVFGFAVRWLGARSGNLIEDSPSDTGDFSIRNKFSGRRK